MITKQVRAWNVRIGDELAWWDAKAKKEVTMVVRLVNIRYPYDAQPYVAMDLYKKDAKRKQVYIYRCLKNALVRVRRKDDRRRSEAGHEESHAGPHG